MKIISAIQNSYYWVKALQLSAREKYVDAVHVLNKTTNRDYEYWSLNAFLKFALRNDEEAIFSVQKAKILIETEKISERDRDYMNAYLSDLESKITESVYNINQVKLEGVSAHILKNFPLRTHSSWVND